MAYLNFQNCTKKEYENVLYSQDAKNKIKIWFNNVELENADLYCEKMTIKSRIVPNGAKSFSLNNFISKEIDLILHDIEESQILDQVRISIGTLVNNTYEYVPIGIFNIQDKPINDKGRITIKLRDNSVKFDFNYNAQPLIEENGGSATKLQILQDICTKASVTCNITSFIGSTDLVGIYDNTIKAREYISRLAENAGRIATINRDGELIFINLNNLTTWEIPLEIVEKYEDGTKYKIGKVVYEDGTRRFESGSSDDTLYLDTSNEYISSQSQVDLIRNEVNSFEINSFKTGKILGNPAIDSYDLIEIEDGIDTYRTLATSELTYKGNMLATYDTQIGEEEKEQNVSLNGEATFKKWARTSIDNINGTVSLQAGIVNDLSGELSRTELLVSGYGADIIVLQNRFDEDGNVSGVKTTENKYTFDDEGLKIKKSDTDYNTLIDNTGTYYKDGETVISSTTKDGFLAKDFRQINKHYYSFNNKYPNDLLNTENYDFVDERVEVDGEYCYATFYNGEE